MGGCLSRGPSQILDGLPVGVVLGGEEAYHQRFLEDVVLGEGEFGQVKLVHDISNAKKNSDVPLACKILRKGITFKDNTLYSPIKPEILRGEVEILQILAGKHYCMNLVAVYESPRNIYIVTEFCGGGAMMEYIAQQADDLRTEDVSRIAFELLSAVNHCAQHGVLHRDIKPENIMFSDPAPKSQMRLIDFGSGCLDAKNNASNDDAPKMHTTFAGSAFYISPEMFQRTYSQKTDVWSAGVTLYVLAAGYPAAQLQKAFNILQTAQGRQLKRLPGLPPDMPDSFYEMLDGLLTYRHKKRPNAGQMLQCEFVQFHKVLEQEEKDAKPLSFEQISMAAHAAAGPEGDSLRANLSKQGRTASIRLTGSVIKHSLFLDFQKFERSFTALLATMLSKPQLERLAALLQERINEQIDNNLVHDHDQDDETKTNESAAVPTATTKSTRNGGKAADDPRALMQTKKDHEDSATMIVDDINDQQQMRLEVILVKELRSILEQDQLLCDQAVLETMEKLPNYTLYGSFAYHVTMLYEFLDAGKPTTGGSSSGASPGGRRRGSFKRTSSFASLRPGIRVMTGSNHSIRSAGSMRGGSGTSRSHRSASMMNIGSPNNNSKLPYSVHRSDLFGSLTQKQHLGGGDGSGARTTTNSNKSSGGDDAHDGPPTTVSNCEQPPVVEQQFEATATSAAAEEVINI